MDCTLHQRYFLTIMAAGDINYQNMIDTKLTGIAKGVGIEFSDDLQSNRSSNNFREQMKQKQKNRMKEERNV